MGCQVSETMNGAPSDKLSPGELHHGQANVCRATTHLITPCCVHWLIPGQVGNVAFINAFRSLLGGSFVSSAIFLIGVFVRRNGFFGRFPRRVCHVTKFQPFWLHVLVFIYLQKMPRLYCKLWRFALLSIHTWLQVRSPIQNPSLELLAA